MTYIDVSTDADGAWIIKKGDRVLSGPERDRALVMIGPILYGTPTICPRCGLAMDTEPSTLGHAVPGPLVIDDPLGGLIDRLRQLYMPPTGNTT